MIDAGELALASIGISTIIADELPKIGKGRIEEMAAIERKIPHLAKKLVAGELTYSAMDRPHSYRRLLDVLGGLPKSVDVNAWIDKFELEHVAELGAPFAIAAQHALNDLASIFPRQSYVTLTGPKDLTPPSQQQWEFFSILDVVNDPLRVFPLMSNAGLLKKQAQAVRMVFPGISAAIDNAIDGAEGAIVDAKTKKVSFQVPQRVTFGISTWQGKRIVEYKPPNVAPAATSPAKRNASKRSEGRENQALSKATASQKLDASGV